MRGAEVLSGKQTKVAEVLSGEQMRLAEVLNGEQKRTKIACCEGNMNPIC